MSTNFKVSVVILYNQTGSGGEMEWSMWAGTITVQLAANDRQDSHFRHPSDDLPPSFGSFRAIGSIVPQSRQSSDRGSCVQEQLPTTDLCQRTVFCKVGKASLLLQKISSSLGHRPPATRLPRKINVAHDRLCSYQ